jgi:hypothetical protein
MKNILNYKVIKGFLPRSFTLFFHLADGRCNISFEWSAIGGHTLAALHESDI